MTPRYNGAPTSPNFNYMVTIDNSGYGINEVTNLPLLEMDIYLPEHMIHSGVNIANLLYSWSVNVELNMKLNMILILQEVYIHYSLMVQLLLKVVELELERQHVRIYGWEVIEMQQMVHSVPLEKFEFITQFNTLRLMFHMLSFQILMRPVHGQEV